MMRSLFAGVSGIRNHQIKMDVIGNNISNVNTVAFKSGRVTFVEALALTTKGASRPTDTTGGINPSQIGLGMLVGVIDSAFNQGSLQTTNVSTDLAINGDGFFVVSDGSKNFYTRDGSFRFDERGRLVSPSDGKIVQGKLTDENGNIQAGTVVQDIVLPFGQQLAAKATSKVAYTGNLDASDTPLGSIWDMGSMLAVEEAGDNSDVNGLFARGNSNSQITGLNSGVTSITVNDGTTSRVYTYVNVDTGSNGDFNSLDDLLTEINADFAGSFSATLTATGSVQMQDLTGSAHTLTFSSDNPTLNSALIAANGIVDSSAGTTTSTDEFSHTANLNEELSKLRNALGISLGLATGNDIIISAEVAGKNATSTFTVGAASTLNDLANEISTTYGITDTNGVSLDPDGSLRISSDPGKVNELTDVSIRVQDNEIFNTVTTPNELQKARDAVHSTSITVYDKLGEAHVVTITYTKTNIKNQWNWEVTLDKNQIAGSGNKGTVTFNSDGSLNSFTYENGVQAFEFDPGTGAETVSIQFDVGERGGLNGLTQFSSFSNAVATSQDGNFSGDLVEVSFDQTGKIEGHFSNGVNRTLAQIVLARFVNPGGLSRSGSNYYAETSASGLPNIGTASESFQSQINTGTLEMSNVNLAQEFTDMIIAQRGFQANSRVITTSDELLTELVNLKR